MAVKIKLKRMGKIHAPYYRIIVADARTKRDGRAIEEIGKYHPKNDPSFIEVDSERAQHWLSVGAQPTDPVRKILEITGDWQKFKGLPGAEGTLKTAAPKADKKDAYNVAVAEALGTGDGAKAKGRKPGAKADGDQGDADASGAKAGSGRSAGRSGGKQTTAGRGAKADTAKADAARPTTPKADTAKADTAKADTAKADTPKADTAKADTAKAETPKADTAKADTAKAETPKADTAEADTAKAETPEADTAEADTAKAETPKAEAASAEKASRRRTRPAGQARPAPKRPARRRRRRQTPRRPSRWPRSRVTEPDMLEEALEHLVKGIVEHPDDVRVDSHGLRRGRVLEVRVHPEDLGKVIGRGGRTAKALRTVIGSLAGGKYVRVDLLDVDEVR